VTCYLPSENTHCHYHENLYSKAALETLKHTHSLSYESMAVL